MELTDAQNRTIKALGLEVEHRRPKCGEVIVYTDGTCGLAVFDFQTDSVPVVVRPALAARVKELEEKLAAESLRLAWADKSLEIRNDNIRVLQEQVVALESELAPIRALKVGSVPWMYHMLATGHIVENKCGTHYRLHNGSMQHRAGEMEWRNRHEGAGLEDYAPFTLHTEPPPAPSAAELCAAIEKCGQSITCCAQCDESDWAKLKKLAAAYRAANAKGGA